MGRRSLSIVIAGAALGADAVAAQDLAVGETLYRESCRNCHGPEAQGMASFPSLVQKSQEYLVERLEQYRAGERVGPNSALMQPNAAGLSDEEIVSVAAFITTSFD